MKTIDKQILSFLLLVFSLSAVPFALVLYVGRIDLGLIAGAGMWCPGLAALICCALFKIKVSSLGWNFYPINYEWLAYLLPILYALPVYLFVWFFLNELNYSGFAKAQAVIYGLANAPNFAALAIAIPLSMSIGVIRVAAFALGEEMGWRGFLFPRLYTRFGFTSACFITGMIWASWHYLLILYGNYNVVTPKIPALICFTLMVVAISFILGFLRLRTNSIWPCVVLHANHNLLIQGILDPMTAKTGKAMYIVGEFGLGLALTTSILAIYLWFLETRQ